MFIKFRYSGKEWPVLAFTGAPATFPVQQQNVGLQKYLKWSEDIAGQRDAFIRDVIGGEKFIGIHLRLGSDFVSMINNTVLGSSAKMISQN